MKMSKSGALLQVVALIVFSSTTIATAHLLGGLGLEGGSLGLPDIQQCLASILGAPGCFNELILSAVSLQPQLLGSACCKAFLQIDENCWPKIFIWNPGFPPSLKNYCMSIQDSPPASPPPPPSNTPPPPIPCDTPPPPPPCGSIGAPCNTIDDPPPPPPCGSVGAPCNTVDDPPPPPPCGSVGAPCNTVDDPPPPPPCGSVGAPCNTVDDGNKDSSDGGDEDDGDK